MAKIRISDMTMKQTAEGFCLSFKEKIELAKLLDKLGVSIIELEGMENAKVDSLRIKSIAAAVKESIIAVPVSLNEENVEAVWNALQTAKAPRLQVAAPVSAVQMEYLYHKKPEAMLATVSQKVKQCAALCKDVEFIAEDATRAEPAYLMSVLQAAIDAGATTVTLCDTAGTMLPGEFAEFIQILYEELTVLGEVSVGVSCVNTLSMADACVIVAAAEGVEEVKVAAYPLQGASLANVVRVLVAKGEAMAEGVSCGVNTAQLSRIVEQIAWICQPGRSKSGAMGGGIREEEGVYLTAHDSREAVAKAVENLGYVLSAEEQEKVYEAFSAIAGKKEQVGIKELDVIVASAAMQVSPTYQLDTYMITAGNTISATAHMRLKKNGETLEGVCLGDGPIDAAFLAIEQITGRHYELDDFQIQAITEGREAMGQTVVKLRSEGRL